MLLDAALIPHGRYRVREDIMAASLDHALWFHRPFRADEWLLYAQDSPNASRRPRFLSRFDLHPGRHPGGVGRSGRLGSRTLVIRRASAQAAAMEGNRCVCGQCRHEDRGGMFFFAVIYGI